MLYGVIQKRRITSDNFLLSHPSTANCLTREPNNSIETGLTLGTTMQERLAIVIGEGGRASGRHPSKALVRESLASAIRGYGCRYDQFSPMASRCSAFHSGQLGKNEMRVDQARAGMRQAVQCVGVQSLQGSSVPGPNQAPKQECSGPQSPMLRYSAAKICIDASSEMLVRCTTLRCSCRFQTVSLH